MELQALPGATTSMQHHAPGASSRPQKKVHLPAQGASDTSSRMGHNPAVAGIFRRSSNSPQRAHRRPREPQVYPGASSISVPIHRRMSAVRWPRCYNNLKSIFARSGALSVRVAGCRKHNRQASSISVQIPSGPKDAPSGPTYRVQGMQRRMATRTRTVTRTSIQVATESRGSLVSPGAAWSWRNRRGP
jgi:hypothetical protein